MIVQHLLFLALLIGLPVWDHFATRRLKASTDPRRRLRSYWQTLGWQWAFVLILAVVIGPRGLFTLGSGALPGWLREEGRALVAGIAAALVVGLIVPIVVARLRPAAAEGLARQLEPLRFFLPHTRGERALFVAVCLTAGICEEIIYRGFALQYLRDLPLGLGLTGALIASALLFGLGHVYQGIGGMLGTAVLAGLFGLCFVVTGNLALPIILHILIDLRVFGLLPFMRRDDDAVPLATQGEAA